jgi:hypothetical protein
MAKRGLLDHEKTINLAETLKIMDVYALGILEAFFQWTAKYHPTGDVSGSKARVFARTIRYNKDPQKLWDALISCGFIDVLDNGVSVVHDWSEHSEHAVHQLLKNRHEAFADGSKPFGRVQKRILNDSQTNHNGFIKHPHSNHKRFTNDLLLPEPEPEPEPEPLLAMEGIPSSVAPPRSPTEPVAPTFRKKHNHGAQSHASIPAIR